MTVGELIDKLKEFDPKFVIVHSVYNGALDYYYDTITDVQDIKTENKVWLG